MASASLRLGRSVTLQPASLRCHSMVSRSHVPPVLNTRPLVPNVLNNHLQHYRHFSDFTGGADILDESQAQEQRPKIVLEAHAPTGFDVSNMIQKVDEEINPESSGDVHMTGSIMAFDRACFLWNGISCADQVTFDSLSPVLVYRPKLKYLFIGCNTPVPNFADIKKRLKQEAGIVAEQLTVHNAMGTFNILNGEDRSVAAALVLDAESTEEEEGD